MTASLTLSGSRVTVGDPITVTVSLEAPPGSTVEWTSPAPTAEVRREAVTPWRFAKSGAGWRVSRRETWAAFQPGLDLRFSYHLRIRGSGPAARETRLVSPVVKVVSVIPREEKDPHPAPFEPPRGRPYLPWETLAGSAVLLVGILFALGRRRGKAPGRAEAPDELFERELTRLDDALAVRPADDDFYDRLSELTRAYLEATLAFPARRETSSEIVRALRSDSRDLPATEIDFTLLACDEFRFARREVRPERARQAIASARRATGLIRSALSPAPAPVTSSAGAGRSGTSP